MSIFRRKPKFKVGDRVEVNSLYLGSPSDLSWPLAREIRRDTIGLLGHVAWSEGHRVAVYLDSVSWRIMFSEWELRHA